MSRRALVVSFIYCLACAAYCDLLLPSVISVTLLVFLAEVRYCEFSTIVTVLVSRSSSLSSAPGRFLKLLIPREQWPSPILSSIFSSEAIMSGRKRKATSAPAAAAAGEEPSAEQHKSSSKKKEKQEDVVNQQRSEKNEVQFNTKRLRFISDAEKIKQGSKGVLYWMSRDQRVQGNNLSEPTLKQRDAACSSWLKCVF